MKIAGGGKMGSMNMGREIANINKIPLSLPQLFFVPAIADAPDRVRDRTMAAGRKRETLPKAAKGGGLG